MSTKEENSFVEKFFDSDIYKEVIARNDTKGCYVVRTTSDSVFLLDKSTNSCIELHFPEEILLAIKECS